MAFKFGVIRLFHKNALPFQVNLTGFSHQVKSSFREQPQFQRENKKRNFDGTERSLQNSVYTQILNFDQLHFRVKTPSFFLMLEIREKALHDGNDIRFCRIDIIKDSSQF